MNKVQKKFVVENVNLFGNIKRECRACYFIMTGGFIIKIINISKLEESKYL